MSQICMVIMIAYALNFLSSQSMAEAGQLFSCVQSYIIILVAYKLRGSESNMYSGRFIEVIHKNHLWMHCNHLIICKIIWEKKMCSVLLVTQRSAKSIRLYESFHYGLYIGLKTNMTSYLKTVLSQSSNHVIILTYSLTIMLTY